MSDLQLTKQNARSLLSELSPQMFLTGTKCTFMAMKCRSEKKTNHAHSSPNDSSDFFVTRCTSPILYLHNTIIHRFYAPKIYIGIVLDIFRHLHVDIFRHLHVPGEIAVIMLNFILFYYCGGGGGGGEKRCIMGFVQVENRILTFVCLVYQHSSMALQEGYI